MEDYEFERQNIQLEVMLKRNADEADKRRAYEEYMKKNIGVDEELEYAPKKEANVGEKVVFYVKAAAVTFLVAAFSFLSYTGITFMADNHHEKQVMDVARDIAPYFDRDVEIGLEINNPDLYYYKNDVAAQQVMAYDGVADIHSTLYSYYVQYGYHPATQLDEVIQEIAQTVSQDPEKYPEDLQMIASCGDLQGYLAARGINDYTTYENVMDQMMIQYVDNEELQPTTEQGGRK